MKIDRQFNDDSLQDLQPGTAFRIGETLLMKTTETDPDGDVVCVDIHTGELHRFPADDVVINPVRAEIKVW